MTRLAKLLYLAMCQSETAKRRENGENEDFKTNAIIDYCLEQKNLYMTTFFLENDLYDKERLDIGILDKISSLFSTCY